ncbi:hypothetical protein LC603019_00488 [Lawsonella clevelandensis]|uniref:Metallothionein n=1 Tax=Lawsonella clevelandensis TaxID=1528099 RepID=A0A5E3ZVV2_9ACTN|nr:hypothetical protein LC603019_00488 [Lawsonella clevelandensis]
MADCGCSPDCTCTDTCTCCAEGHCGKNECGPDCTCDCHK